MGTVSPRVDVLGTIHMVWGKKHPWQIQPGNDSKKTKKTYKFCGVSSEMGWKISCSWIFFVLQAPQVPYFAIPSNQDQPDSSENLSKLERKIRILNYLFKPFHKLQ